MSYRIFAPEHSFSQLITSFFASESHGIHHAPLFCFPYFFCLVIFALVPAVSEYIAIPDTAVSFFVCLSFALSDTGKVIPLYLFLSERERTYRYLWLFAFQYVNDLFWWRITDSNR